VRHSTFSQRPLWPRNSGDKTGGPIDRSMPRARGARTTGRGGVFRLRVENSHLPMDSGPTVASARPPDRCSALLERVSSGSVARYGGASAADFHHLPSRPGIPGGTDLDGLNHPFRRTTTNNQYTRIASSVDTRSLGQVSSFDRPTGFPRTSRPREHRVIRDTPRVCASWMRSRSTGDCPE
jgi:hypothetical protein